MARVEMVMPKMGESIMEGTVLQWLKQAGDTIEQDESVLEVATDKVDTEVPATHAGVLEEILVQEGDVVPVGAPIAVIATEATVAADAPTPADAPPAVEPTPKVTSNAPPTAPVAVAASTADRFYSPLVLNIARTEGISGEELGRVPGTGKDERVTKRDILAYVKQRREAPAAAPTPVSTALHTPPPNGNGHAAHLADGDTEIVEMDRMRRMIADRMVESKRVSPHVTSFVEADVTNLVRWRNRHKETFKAREGESLTFTPLFVEAIVRAIQEFPLINVSVDGTRIVRKKSINVGVAVALPSGNLIVPVIHNADQYNLTGLAKRVNDLARRARANKLRPDELAGGTYTISNVGSFGNVMGTPIIMQPQVAIMAVGAIRKKPAVLETPDGDVIAIRHQMFLSHSYDHRVVDGALGGMFVRRVADHLEHFDVERTP
ncbi:MAG: dihydrolipoamide acetyltransferase family protein [Catalinimonas sp.]